MVMVKPESVLKGGWLAAMENGSLNLGTFYRRS
jgi:hypothetical protein